MLELQVSHTAPGYPRRFYEVKHILSISVFTQGEQKHVHARTCTWMSASPKLDTFQMSIETKVNNHVLMRLNTIPKAMKCGSPHQGLSEAAAQSPSCLMPLAGNSGKCKLMLGGTSAIWGRRGLQRSKQSSKEERKYLSL